MKLENFHILYIYVRLKTDIRIMCTTSGNFFMNMMGDNYQYGSGIAALFSGLSGCNYTYNNYNGFGNYNMFGFNYNFIGNNYYNNGCCGGNWDNKSIWKAVLGGAAGTVCSIGSGSVKTGAGVSTVVVCTVVFATG